MTFSYFYSNGKTKCKMGKYNLIKCSTQKWLYDPKIGVPNQTLTEHGKKQKTYPHSVDFQKI